MAITFVGEYKFPETDNANDTGTSLTFDKDNAGVSGIASGDLVFVFLNFRSTSSGFSVTTTGGQTWTEHHDASNNNSNALYTCVFNGTWDADPVWDMPGTTAFARILWVWVLRGVHADIWDVTPTWALDSDTAFQLADFNTNTDGAWAFFMAGTGDNNTWTVDNSAVAPSGSGQVYWTSQGGTDLSAVLCYKEIPTAGAVGATTMTQATLGADAGYKVFGALKPAAAAGEQIDGVVLTVTPTLPAGALTHTITGVALTATPTLPAGTVTGVGVDITGVVLTITPTQPAGALTHSLSGVTLSATPTQPAGRLNHGLSGVTLTATPSQPAGRLNHSLTAVALTATPTFPTGKLNHSLTAVALTATPTFPQGQVTVPGAQTVTGVVLTISPTLPAGLLQVALTGVTLTVTPTLPAGKLNHGVMGVALTIAPTLPAGAVIAATQIIGVTHVITIELPAGALTIPGQATPVKGPTRKTVLAGPNASEELVGVPSSVPIGAGRNDTEEL